jgi:hypothetical protein
VARFLNYLDRVIDAGLVFVLVFTPLAFGAVEGWARAIGQLAILFVFSAWVLKITWGPSPRIPGPNVILGGRVRLSGVEWPALAFVVVILLQLVPLPPSVMRTISPRTAEIFAASLPGYGESGSPSFAGLPAWLHADSAEAGGVPTLPPNPEQAALAFPVEVLDVPHSAWRPLSLTPAHTRRLLGVFLAHLAVFVVAFNHLGEGRRLQRYMFLLVGLSAVLSIIGILQSLSSPDKLYWWRGSSYKGSFGPFVNHNNFSGWMELVLPLGAGLAVMFWERQRRNATAPGTLVEQAGRSYSVVMLLGFTTTINLTAFVLAESRGGFASLAAALTVLLVLYAARGQLRWRAVAVGAVTALLALAMTVWINWSGVWERYSTLSDLSEDRSFIARLDYSRHTLAMATDFPVLGTGFGTFREAYELYTPGTSSTDLARAHNDYAQVMAEAGLLRSRAAAPRRGESMARAGDRRRRTGAPVP